MLEVCALSKAYGRSMAIEDITFSAHAGEVVGIVGHNGCGKSTTMNIITGYLTATSGTVTVDGEDHVRCAASVRRKIGYLPENPPLYPDMTVEEQLTFACGLKGIGGVKAAIASACEKADVSGVRRRLIRNLSKGYRQRIGLAQAMLGEPRLLILDEPTSGLDPRQIAEMREIIARESRERTVLMSSHVLSEISAMCTRVVVLSNGRLVADDTPDGLQSRMSREGQYELTACGGADALLGALRALEGACSAELLPPLQEGALRILLDMRAEDAALAAASAVHRAGGRLIAFAPVRPTLEEVFLTLTCDQRYEKREGRRADGR